MSSKIVQSNTNEKCLKIREKNKVLNLNSIYEKLEKPGCPMQASSRNQESYIWVNIEKTLKIQQTHFFNGLAFVIEKIKQQRQRDPQLFIQQYIYCNISLMIFYIEFIVFIALQPPKQNN